MVYRRLLHILQCRKVARLNEFNSFEYLRGHQSNIIRIVYSSRVSGSDLLFILKICNKKRELADFTPQALVPFLSVSNGKPFRFRPQWRYPCVNQWDHSYLIFY